MRTYNQQIEDAYTGSKRQGDAMRDRDIERSSGQDRRNRYNEDIYQHPDRYQPFDESYRGEDQRTDRYGYERSSFYGTNRFRGENAGKRDDEYPETYRSAASGYISAHVGHDLGRRDPEFERVDLYRENNGPHRGRGPKNYKRSDERIREEILDKLTDDPYIDATNIEVTVHSGEVTLMGIADERNAKRRAEDLADSVSGVTNVENRLKIQPTSDENTPRETNATRWK